MRNFSSTSATCCDPDEHPERAVWQARVVELIGQGVRPCVRERKVVLGEGVEMAFSFIPPGAFLMGSPPQEEGQVNNEVLHRVTLTRGSGWASTRLGIARRDER